MDRCHSSFSYLRALETIDEHRFCLHYFTNIGSRFSGRRNFPTKKA
jgi:hypothetical protein